MTATTSEIDDSTSNIQSESEKLSHNYESWLSVDLPEGRCVGLRLGDWTDDHPQSLSLNAIESNARHWIHDCLHPEEVSFGLDLSSTCARQTFYLGRLAMRQALGQEEQTLLDGSCVILRDDHGRPTLPDGYLGSISHKGIVGVALVAKVSEAMTGRMGIGIDVENTHSKRRNIAKRILTPQEVENLGRVEGITKEEEVLLRFSIKESLYKAMHPLICQFVGFQEGDVTPHSNGTATINLNVKSGAHKQFDKITAHWRHVMLGDEPFFLTSVSITLLPGSGDDEPCTMET